MQITIIRRQLSWISEQTETITIFSFKYYMSENIHDPPIQIRNLCTKNHVFMINKITHVDMLKLFNSHRKLLIAQSPCDRKKYSNQEFKFSRVRIFPGWPTGFQFSITGCYDLVIYFTGNSTHLLKQRLFSVKYLNLDVLKTIKYKYWIKSW